MSRQTEALAHGRISTLLWTYAGPAIIANTATSLYNVIDRIFIGQGVGDLALAGITIAAPIMNLSTAFGTLVGTGAAAIVSLRLGERRRETAQRILAHALTLSLIIALLFAATLLLFLDPVLVAFGASPATLPYARSFMRIILIGNVCTHLLFGLNSIMRASGYPRKAMVSILLTVCCNILLAPIFIFGCHMGIQGAAWATVLSQLIGMIWVVAHFLNPNSLLHFDKHTFGLQRTLTKEIFSIGLSPFIVHICTSLIAVVMNRQLLRFGDDVSVAAYGIINSVMSLMTMLILGLTQGMQPIVGYNYGARQRERVFSTLWLTNKVATLICVCGFAVWMLFPYSIAQLFSDSPGLNSMTASAMRKCALMFPVIGFQMVVSFFFQSIGMAKTSIFLSLSRQMLFLLPFIFLLPHLFGGLDGIWYAIPCADLCALVVAALILHRKYPQILT